MNRVQWKNVFAVDFRSLAFFRIGLGVFIIVDVWQRFPFNEAFLSDSGFMPRESAMEFKQIGNWSLNFLNGAVEFQSGLMILLAIAAFALCIGFGTRIATLICWALVISMHVRMPFVLNGGDTLLRGMLFWSLFLPLGKVWSIDAKLFQKKASHRPGSSCFSMATVAIILQICFLYWFAGIAKLNAIWFSGDAIQYALQINMLTKTFGTNLLEHPIQLRLITHFTPFVELLAPLLLFLPWKNDRIRLLLILAFWSFHVGIWFCISVGLFSLMSMISWSVLIPSSFWDRFSNLPNSHDNPNEEERIDPFQNLLYRGLQVGILIVLIYVALWNIANIDASDKFGLLMPDSARKFGRSTGLTQEFKMFGQLSERTRWFVYEGTLRNGEKWDIFRDAKVDRTKPAWASQGFPSQRWRKLHRNMVLNNHKSIRENVARFIFDKWNDSHEKEKQVVHLRLICVTQMIGPNATEGTVEANFAIIETEDYDPFLNMLESDELFN